MTASEPRLSPESRDIRARLLSALLTRRPELADLPVAAVVVATGIWESV